MEGETCCICLEVFDDIANLDSCEHRYCFKCILEWSKIKPICPYCKIEFKTICHSVDGIEVIEPVVLKVEDESSDLEVMTYVILIPDILYSISVLLPSHI